LDYVRPREASNL